jgi:hypothetical protein
MNTYTLLAATVARWLNREGFTTLTDEVEDFIAMGQRRIHRECDLNAMKVVDAAFVIDAQAMAVPAGYLRTKTLTIQSGTNNFEVTGGSHKQVMKYGTSARPQHYSTIDTDFYFGPPPDQSYTAQLVYFKGLDIVSTTTATNWITTNIPELLLFATLLEAAMFLKDDARAAMWEARFKDTKNQLETSEARQDKESGSLQVRTM